MSTLNRALAKIYGQPGAQAQRCTEHTAEIADCPNADPVDRPEDNASVQQHELAQVCGGDAFDSLDTSSDLATINILAGDPFADIESASILELPKTTLRIDGPSPNAVEPPHLSFENEDAIEAKPLSLTGQDSEIEPAANAAVAGGHAEKAENSDENAVDAGESLMPSSSQHSAPLSPEWEVDRFRWPETCQQLLLEKDEEFGSAIESLCSMRNEGRLIVALVAETSGNGSSTTALCIARQAAQLGHNVLLVDADVSAPKLAGLVGLNTPCSWHDSVVGDVPLAESIVVSVEDQLCLMPLHSDCEQSSLILTDERVAALLNAAGAVNDLIILDCGSIDRLTKQADTNGHLPCDVAVIVRDASHETDGDPAEATDKLRSLGVDSILFAENFVREPKPTDQKLKSSAA